MGNTTSIDNYLKYGDTAYPMSNSYWDDGGGSDLTIGGLSPNSKSSGASNALSGIQGAIPLITTTLGILAQNEDRKRKNAVRLKNMQNRAEVLSHSQHQKAQQLKDLNTALGDKLSASGMDALKAEARLKASSAETGSTSNQEAIDTAEVNRLHRDAVYARDAEIMKSNTQSAMVAERLGFSNEMDSMLSGQDSGLSTFLQTISSGLSGMNAGLGMITQSGREDFYGTNTTGA